MKSTSQPLAHSDFTEEGRGLQNYSLDIWTGDPVLLAACSVKQNPAEVAKPRFA